MFGTVSRSASRTGARTLQPHGDAIATAVRPPRRGMSIDSYTTHHEVDNVSDAARQRTAQYRYMETLTRQQPWASQMDPERSRESMEKAMASSMNLPRAPRRRNTSYVNTSYTNPDEVQSWSDDFSGMRHDVERDFDGKYQQELFKATPVSNIRNYLQTSRAPKEVTPEDVLHATTAAYADETTIDPITNRRVYKYATPQAATQKYEDLDKYGPVRWNEPDGLRKATPEEKSKEYSDLDKYTSVRWNEPDGLRKLTPEEESKNYDDLHSYHGPRTADKSTIDAHEASQMDATPKGEPRASRVPVADASAPGKEYNDLGSYGPVYWNEPDGLRRLTPEEKSKQYEDVQDYARRTPNAPRHASAVENVSGTSQGSSLPFGGMPGGFGSASTRSGPRANVIREHDWVPEHQISDDDGFPMTHLEAEALNKAYDERHEYEPSVVNRGRAARVPSQKAQEYDGFGTHTARLYKEPQGLPGSLADQNGQHPSPSDTELLHQQGKAAVDEDSLTADQIRANVLRRVRDRSQERSLDAAKDRHNSEWEPAVNEALEKLEMEGSTQFHTPSFHKLESDHVNLSQVIKDHKEARGLHEAEGRHRSEWDPVMKTAVDNLESEKSSFAKDPEAQAPRVPLSSRVHGEQHKLSDMNENYRAEWEPEVNSALESLAKEPRPAVERDGFTKSSLGAIEQDMTKSANRIEEPVATGPSLESKVRSQDERHQAASERHRAEWEPVTKEAMEQLDNQHSESPFRRLNKENRVTLAQLIQDHKDIRGLEEASQRHQSEWHPTMAEAHDQLEKNPQQTLTAAEFSTKVSSQHNTRAPEEPDVSSMDESFPSDPHPPPSRLEPALNRLSRSQTSESKPPSPEADDGATRPMVKHYGSTHKDPEAAESSRTYRILAYDAATDAVHAAEMVSAADETTPRSPADVIPRLTNPAKFFPHLSSVQAEGYELVSGEDNILIFRQTSGASSPGRRASQPINPIDMMGKPVTGNFASPTGFVNYDRLPDEKTEKPAPPFRSNMDVRREEDVFSGQKGPAKPMRRKSSLGKKMVLGTAYVAGSAYAVGVIAEYFASGGGPRNL